MNEKGGVELLGLNEINDILKTLIPREANNLSKNMIAGFAQYAAKKFKARVPSETGNLKRSIKAVKADHFRANQYHTSRHQRASARKAAVSIGGLSSMAQVARIHSGRGHLWSQYYCK